MDCSIDSIDERITAIATSAASLAGAYLLSQHGVAYRTRQKSRRDTQYNIDRRANQIILQYLHEQMPMHGLFSEESGMIEGDESCVWIVDPLDGSANYVRGSMLYGVVIGLRVRGVLALGVIHLPATREMFVAIRGRGTYCNEKPVSVSPTDDLRDAFIHFGVFHSNAGAASKRAHFVNRYESVVQRIRILGASAVDFAYVSSGRSDALLMQPLNPWDDEVGRLILTEAGGRHATVSLRGNESVLVASNAALHEPLVAMMRQLAGQVRSSEAERKARS